MIRKIIVTVLSCVWVLNSGRATDLVVQEIMEPTTSLGSKPLQARVEEIARTERTSTVKVNVYSGTSVARAMIVVRGLWLIGKARGDEYFWTLNQSVSADGTRTLIVGYANEQIADPAAYFDIGSRVSSDKAQPIDKPMRVSDFDLVFNSRSR